MQQHQPESTERPFVRQLSLSAQTLQDATLHCDCEHGQLYAKREQCVLEGLIGTQVLVQEGETAEEGDAVIVLEAMKMEHTVRAPCGGTVTGLRCFVGAQVEDGHVLATVVPATPV